MAPESNGGTCKGHSDVDREGQDKDMKEEECDTEACPGNIRYIITRQATTI